MIIRAEKFKELKEKETLLDYVVGRGRKKLRFNVHKREAHFSSKLAASAQEIPTFRMDGGGQY